MDRYSRFFRSQEVKTEADARWARACRRLERLQAKQDLWKKNRQLEDTQGLRRYSLEPSKIR